MYQYVNIGVLFNYPKECSQKKKKYTFVKSFSTLSIYSSYDIQEGWLSAFVKKKSELNITKKFLIFLHRLVSNYIQNRMSQE